ncbi:NAD-dependent epimerase/dehydratase family protein [Candidatus Pelagibacter sp. HIMB1695]|uniref:NAD-dependent epimerase/dehydratase family protein n=1 Tax=Candidatus Pelagibacter sp. HIMB1695 TaxID=3413364 RepID=UPI003F852170
MSEKVLLTGISGFVAKHIAIELLNSSYEVLGTVRNSNSIEQTKKTLEENNVAINNLSFVELDLLKDEGWNEAAKGCKYIIHVASPFPLKVSNDRESLTPAAKDGTLRVLNAGIHARVEHFVKTSSIVCMFRKPNRSNPYTFGENDWTDLDWDKTTDYFYPKQELKKLRGLLWKVKVLKIVLRASILALF